MMMDETRKMMMEVRGITLLMMGIGCILAALLFPAIWKQAVGGVAIGAFTGLMGFNMISNMVSRIDGEMADIKARAFRSYTRRYLLYAIIFGLSAIAGMPIAALLAGMLLHKLSILMYSWKNRKEDV